MSDVITECLCRRTGSNAWWDWVGKGLDEGLETKNRNSEFCWREKNESWGENGVRREFHFFFKTGENYSAPVGWWGWLSRKGNGKAGAGRTALVMSARWAGHTSGGVSLGTTSQTPRAQVQVGGCALAETMRVCFCLFHVVSFFFFGCCWFFSAQQIIRPKLLNRCAEVCLVGVRTPF